MANGSEQLTMVGPVLNFGDVSLESFRKCDTLLIISFTARMKALPSKHARCMCQRHKALNRSL